MQPVAARQNILDGRPAGSSNEARQVQLPGVWARMFERVVTTAAVLVISAAEVTQRYAPQSRTAALAGLWSGLVALAGLCWAASAVVAGLARLRRRVGAGRRAAGGGEMRPPAARQRSDTRGAMVAQVVRALAVAAVGGGVLWSRSVLVSAWLPLCVGLVEGISVVVTYRLFLAYRLAAAATEGKRP